MAGPPAGAADAASLSSAGDVPVHGADPPMLAETARLVSAWGWAEGRLYEVVGGWVPSTIGPAAKIYFDVCSQHHAWRARLWEERRPGLPAHFVPNYDGNGSAMDALTTLDDDVGRLSAYCRVVLPHLVVGYRSWQRRCLAGSDQPVARALSFVLADVVTDWERGSGLLQGHLDGDGDGQAALSAADAARSLDRALALKGLWPSR